MAEIRVQVDDGFLQSLMSVLNLNDAGVMKEALTMLSWAVGERRTGRVILSASSDGCKVRRLAMPSLETIAESMDAAS